MKNDSTHPHKKNKPLEWLEKFDLNSFTDEERKAHWDAVMAHAIANEHNFKVRIDRKAYTVDFYGVDGYTRRRPYFLHFGLIGSGTYLHIQGKAWATPNIMVQVLAALREACPEIEFDTRDKL